MSMYMITTLPNAPDAVGSYATSQSGDNRYTLRAAAVGVPDRPVERGAPPITLDKAGSAGIRSPIGSTSAAPDRGRLADASSVRPERKKSGRPASARISCPQPAERSRRLDAKSRPLRADLTRDSRGDAKADPFSIDPAVSMARPLSGCRLVALGRLMGVHRCLRRVRWVS